MMMIRRDLQWSDSRTSLPSVKIGAPNVVSTHPGLNLLQVAAEFLGGRALINAHQVWQQAHGGNDVFSGLNGRIMAPASGKTKHFACAETAATSGATITKACGPSKNRRRRNAMSASTPIWWSKPHRLAAIRVLICPRCSAPRHI